MLLKFIDGFRLIKQIPEPHQYLYFISIVLLVISGTFLLIAGFGIPVLCLISICGFWMSQIFRTTEPRNRNYNRIQNRHIDDVDNLNQIPISLENLKPFKYNLLEFTDAPKDCCICLAQFRFKCQIIQLKCSKFHVFH